LAAEPLGSSVDIIVEDTINVMHVQEFGTRLEACGIAGVPALA
jgi:hypothetical protein